jgi:hypothetical protein
LGFLTQNKHSIGKAVSFIKNFILEPIHFRSVSLAKFRWSQLLHVRTGGVFDRLYQRWSALARPPISLPLSRRMDAQAIQDAVAELKAEGCKVLPFTLTSEEISSLRDFAFTEPAYAVNISERIRITKDTIPHDHGRYYWPMQRLVQCPAVRDILSDSALYAIAQDYLGARPVLTHVNLWLDPVFDGCYDPHVYHYDNDGPGFLKFFFYITDVGPDTGAHRFIRGSHSHSKPAQFSASKRYKEDDLLAYYGADREVVFSAPAGTVLAEDTAGFHRGTDLKQGYRLLMQFQFSLIDIPTEADLAGVTRVERIPSLDPYIAKIAGKFYAV